MKLFLVCPQCTHLFESTSTQLIENAGRVECPSCEYLFDGYAHYRFDGLEADQPVKKGSYISSIASTEQKPQVDISSSDKQLILYGNAKNLLSHYRSTI